MVENPDNRHFHQYFKIIRTRFWVIFTIFSLTVMSGWYVTNEVLQKVYSATAEIQVKPRGVTSIRGFDDGVTEKPFDPITFQAEMEIMKSNDALLPIVNDLGLDKAWAKRVFKLNTDRAPALMTVAQLENGIDVSLKKGTNIIEITADSDVPQEAADIANALADHYKTVREVEEDQRSGRGTDSLREQIAKQEAIVSDKKAVLTKMRQEAGNLDISIAPGSNGAAERADSDLDSRKHDLLSARQDSDARRVLMESVQNLPDEEFVNTLSALGREEPNIAALRSASFTTESDIDNLLKQGFDENHPRIQALRAEQERRKQQIKELIAGTRRALIVDAQMAQSRVELLSKEVDELMAKTLKDQNSHLAPYREAERDYEQQQNILDAYNIRLKQVLADRQLLESPVRIISRATAPANPSKPNKNVLMFISIVAGLFWGVVVACLIEYLDTSVKTMADAESLLGLPVLTVIPNKGGPMPLNAQSGKMPQAEGYRILRAKLDLKVQNGIGPSLTMLSGGPGEGKSTTIYNLAVVCAQSGQSVILIDCDLRRPVVHDMLKLSNDRGLANYLRGEGDAVEYIQQTSLPTLHALTAGDMPMSDIGSLTGDKIRIMLDDLKQRYDLVLIDSPPVLGISDGSIIAREVDYVILVIQHRRYPREISLRAKRAIEEVHGNCVGMVLNSVAVRSDDSYYYYSNYGNYYKKADRDKKRKVNPKKNGKPVLASSRKADLQSEEF